MKKIALVLLVTGSALFSSASMAQTATAFTGSAQVTGGTAGTCPLLAEDVTLNASANVVAAWSCDEANTIIRTAACHRGGARVPLLCALTDPQDPQSWNVAGCTTAGEPSGEPDYRAYGASSRGGVIAQYALGGRCEDGTLTGLGFWSE